MPLELQHVSKTFHGEGGPVAALDDVSLTVAPGEMVAVRGPSGSGKTTLLLAAGGLLAPDAGRVLVSGTDPYSLGPDARARLRRREIGFVFQQFHLVPYLDVLENVLTPAVEEGGAEIVARARELLERFGLSPRAAHRPSELSTGEKQRVALARALLLRPSIVLADEPSGNLDDANATEVLAALGEAARNGAAVLLVTHDPRAAAAATRAVMLEAGRVTGKPRQSEGGG